MHLHKHPIWKAANWQVYLGNVVPGLPGSWLLGDTSAQEVLALSLLSGGLPKNCCLAVLLCS